MSFHTLVHHVLIARRTYWMAGLAHDAAHFFKFLFILVLYSLAMTLFVSNRSLIHRYTDFLTFLSGIEFPPRMFLPERWRCDPPECAIGIVPNDICWVLRAPTRYSSSVALAAVALPTQIYARGA